MTPAQFSAAGTILCVLLTIGCGFRPAPEVPADPAADALANDLDSPELDVKLRTIDQLGAFGPAARNAVPALLRALDDNDHEQVRVAAAKALARIQRQPQTVKREVSRRYVGRKNERRVGDTLVWEDEYEIQYRIETIMPDD